ncbi:MAG: UDP-glucose 4-epimerase GalE [Actinobacteria bacterium]|nr:UDP-glucose 4-epimerase GalE [Actinomycetota bacterium]
MTVLVTGGAGFIGSHACVELLQHGHDLVVVDDFSNSSPGALAAVRQLAPAGQLAVAELDIRDRDGLSRVFDTHAISAVVHFAGKKAVDESLRIPLDYFDVNIAGTTSLLRAMTSHGVRRLVFSSSCSIYGDRYPGLICEDDQPAPTNPYARSKLFCEQILADTCARYQDLSAIALRYFNPAGAHPSGLLGEAPPGMPGNLMPAMMQAAAGLRDKLQVFGTDYPTPDGSAIRDYIHVADLAQAHRIAIGRLDDEPGFRALNVGTGVGISVLELISAFEQACGITVPCQLAGRRPGDATSAVADPSRIDKHWGWRTSLDIHAMCRHAWHFQQRHPHGYHT